MSKRDISNVSICVSGEACGRTHLAVDTRRVAFERVQEALDELGEAVLAETFDERAECLGRRSTGLRDRVDEDDVDERHERRY